VISSEKLNVYADVLDDAEDMIQDIKEDFYDADDCFEDNEVEDHDAYMDNAKKGLRELIARLNAVLVDAETVP